LVIHHMPDDSTKTLSPGDLLDVSIINSDAHDLYAEPLNG